MDKDLFDISKDLDVVKKINEFMPYKSEFCKVKYFSGRIEDPSDIYRIPLSNKFILNVGVVEIHDEFSSNVEVWIGMGNVYISRVGHN